MRAVQRRTKSPLAPVAQGGRPPPAPLLLELVGAQGDAARHGGDEKRREAEDADAHPMLYAL